MKSYLPYLWAGLWLMGSCSTPDPDPGADMPQPGFSVQYTLFPDPGLSTHLMEVAADASTLEPLPAADALPASDADFIWHQDVEGFSMLLRQESCEVEAVLYDRESGNLLRRPALADMDPCKTEVLSVIHDGSTLYILYSTEATEIKPEHHGLRKLSMTDGMAEDLIIPERPVDLDKVSGKLLLLTQDTGDDPLSTIRTIDQQEMMEVSATPVGYDARMVLRLGMNQLLIGFEDAHMILSGTSLEIIDEVRYQAGSEPGFTGLHPWASGDGSVLYFPYPSVNPDDPGKIGGVYELDRRTLILYAFDNFLDAVQREVEYDIGQATAVGRDSRNGYLLIGYEKGTDPSKGGLLRLQTEPEFKFVDQADLLAPPIAILSD